MARPPFPLGIYGRIKTWQEGKTWLARAQFHDYDGMIRPVKRTGKTKAAAERALQAALVDRQAPVKQAEITAETKVAELWLADVERAVDAAPRAPGDARCLPLDLPAAHEGSAGVPARAGGRYPGR